MRSFIFLIFSPSAFCSPSYDDDLSTRPKVKKKKRKSFGKRKRKRFVPELACSRMQVFSQFVILFVHVSQVSVPQPVTSEEEKEEKEEELQEKQAAQVLREQDENIQNIVPHLFPCYSYRHLLFSRYSSKKLKHRYMLSK